MLFSVFLVQTSVQTCLLPCTWGQFTFKKTTVKDLWHGLAVVFSTVSQSRTACAKLFFRKRHRLTKSAGDWVLSSPSSAALDTASIQTFHLWAKVLLGNGAKHLLRSVDPIRMLRRL